jgi:hypothetical protein
LYRQGSWPDKNLFQKSADSNSRQANCPKKCCPEKSLVLQDPFLTKDASSQEACPDLSLVETEAGVLSRKESFPSKSPEEAEFLYHTRVLSTYESCLGKIHVEAGVLSRHETCTNEKPCQYIGPVQIKALPQIESGPDKRSLKTGLLHYYTTKNPV